MLPAEIDIFRPRRDTQFYRKTFSPEVGVLPQPLWP